MQWPTLQCEQTTQFQLEIGAAAFFATFCATSECFLVYSCDTLTLPFTEIWFDSRRNWVPTGEDGGGGAIIHAICLKVFAFLQTQSKSGGAVAAAEEGVYWVCVSPSLRPSLSNASSSFLFKCSNSQSKASLGILVRVNVWFSFNADLRYKLLALTN